MKLHEAVSEAHFKDSVSGGATGHRKEHNLCYAKLVMLAGDSSKKAHTHTHACMHTLTHITCAHTHTLSLAHACIHAIMHITCTHTHTHSHTCIHACTHAHYRHMRAHTHTHTHTHAHACTYTHICSMHTHKNIHTHTHKTHTHAHTHTFTHRVGSLSLSRAWQQSLVMWSKGCAWSS